MGAYTVVLLYYRSFNEYCWPYIILGAHTPMVYYRSFNEYCWLYIIDTRGSFILQEFQWILLAIHHSIHTHGSFIGISVNIPGRTSRMHTHQDFVCNHRSICSIQNCTPWFKQFWHFPSRYKHSVDSATQTIHTWKCLLQTCKHFEHSTEQTHRNMSLFPTCKMNIYIYIY